MARPRKMGPLEDARHDAIIVAMELCYSKEAIRRLMSATTENQIQNILSDARKGKI